MSLLYKLLPDKATPKANSEGLSFGKYVGSESCDGVTISSLFAHNYSVAWK